jgi:hypothetical protein
MAKAKKTASKTNGKPAKKAAPPKPVAAAKPSATKTNGTKPAKKAAPKPEPDFNSFKHAIAGTMSADVWNRSGGTATLVDVHQALEDELVRVQHAMCEVEELMEAHGETTTLDRI